jgi:hypothetical protein
LAWSVYQNGDDARALKILQNNVMQQTEEPLALYFTGTILKGTGNTLEAKKYLNQALDAGFELGPVLKAEIEGNLAAL